MDSVTLVLHCNNTVSLTLPCSSTQFYNESFFLKTDFILKTLILINFTSISKCSLSNKVLFYPQPLDRLDQLFDGLIEYDKIIKAEQPEVKICTVL